MDVKCVKEKKHTKRKHGVTTNLGGDDGGNRKKSKIEGLSGNLVSGEVVDVSEDKRSRKEKKREKRRLRGEEQNDCEKIDMTVEKSSIVEGSDRRSRNNNESTVIMNSEVGTVIEEVKDKKEKKKKKKSKSKPEIEGLSSNGVSEVVLDVDVEANVSEDNKSRKEKKREKRRLRVEEPNDCEKMERKAGKSSVVEGSDRRSTNDDESTGVMNSEVRTVIEEVKDRKEKKKKKKSESKPEIEGLSSNGVSEVVLDVDVDVEANVSEDSRSRKEKRKEKRRLRGEEPDNCEKMERKAGRGDECVTLNNIEDSGVMNGEESNRKTMNDDESTGGVMNSEVGVVIEKAKLVKDKKKADGDGGSKKRKKKSLAINTEENTTDGVSVTNEGNEPTEPAEKSNPSKKLRKVKFADTVEVFPLPDNSSEGEENLEGEGHSSEGEENLEGENLEDGNKKKNSDDGLVRGKRFSKEEDEMVRNAVLQYIEDHQLGEEGVNMVMKCSKHKEIKDCWNEIAEALPWRSRVSIYSRAHILFERSESSKWTKEELEEVRKYHEKHGPKWRELADEIGRNRIHVKDAFRQVKLPNKRTGQWSQDEYQKLFNLVNKDLRIRASMDRKSKHGMLRDNIGWETISDMLTTRTDPICCMKWYNQLTSALVACGKWADTDDYRLLMALDELDATCEEDVDWDNVLEHRSGDVCRKRWNEMVRHIGEHGNKSFSEQVEILSQRYCPDVLEARETYDNKPIID